MLDLFMAACSGKQGIDIGDNIPYSIMLDSGASQYLSRTFGTPTSNLSWCLSEFDKLGKLGVAISLLSAGDSEIRLTAGSQLEFYKDGAIVATSTALERDPLGHGHIFIRSNGTNIKGYLNTVEIISYTGTMPDINSAVLHTFGRYQASAINYFDGYRSLPIFVDGGGLLTPQDFVRFSSRSEQWVNKNYSGTYGNNGSKLEFADPSFATYGLGKDTSGNNNHWTPNGGITSANQYTDTPTNNHCVLNPIGNNTLTAGTFYIEKGNTYLTVTNNSGYRNAELSLVPEGQKGYFEFKHIGTPNGYFGVQYQSTVPTNGTYLTAGSFQINSAGGNVMNGGATLSTCISPLVSNDTMMIAFDFTGGKRDIWWGLNGVWGNSGSGVGNPATGAFPHLTIATITAACRFFFAINTGGGTYSLAFNFGAKPFAYTPPTGFPALNTANIPEGTAAAPATFQGYANAEGPFIWCNGTPETATINGNVVTWGTHADRTAGGIKIRTASASYNAAGSNTLSCTFLTPNKKSVFKYQTAKGNP